MGSLNNDGTRKLQLTNSHVFRHQGNFIAESTTNNDTRLANISSSGVIRTHFDSKGVIWQSGGTAASSGLPADARNADNSVEREKFTHNSAPDGNLQQHVTRALGVHTSVSDRQAISDATAANVSGLVGGDTDGPMQTISERKVFFLDDDRNQTPLPAGLTIFNQAGDAVGPDLGTTDVDNTPNEGLLGN